MLAVLGAAAATACSPQQGAPQAQGAGAAATESPTASPTASPSGATIRLSGEGTFAPYKEGEKAIVYDEKLVPSGAKADVSVKTEGEETISKLDVEGLLPDRQYGAHLHVNPCGQTPDSSGPHFRGEEQGGTASPSPSGGTESPTVTPEGSPTGATESPAESPAESPTGTPEGSPTGSPTAEGPANPTNEVWLDFKTNGEGDAEAKARQPWALTAGRLPGSLVIHAKPTTTSGAHAGEAGDRVACLTLSPTSGD
ncbi:hypothetical protein [Spongiactinospora sp. TRM90649]|uniref:hypothetical protein n=1 Tax=Spongiactinospora sp. TRM90649 TaxID=3031114 RepID=UPI0023F8EADF|nr:hypothetical protein [Spongiactinospora sp. TRM90649]MDF5757239.1 hypothetical protein [Spongiactinospora sp. TRM90649]